MKYKTCIPYLIAGISGMLAPVIGVFIALEVTSRNQASPDYSAATPLEIDLQSILGGNWDVGTWNYERLEDMAGWDSSVIGHVEVNAHHQTESLAYVREHIIVYRGADDASRRYGVQAEWIFDLDYGVPPTRQTASYTDIDLSLLPDSVQSIADHRVACIVLLFDTRCGGIFLYRNFVIYLDVFVRRHGVIYLSRTEFLNLIEAVGDRIASYP